MYKVTFKKPVKTIDDLYSKVKQSYMDANIPMPYPAANKHLQARLTAFASKGLSNEQTVVDFDKVNSNRVYSLEKHGELTRLVMSIKENEQPKKVIVLSIDEEIKIVVTSFIQVFEKTGFIESTPKCHKRLQTDFAISDKRIRIVQRLIAKFVVPSSHNDENKCSESENYEMEVDEPDVLESKRIENESKSNEKSNNMHDSQLNNVLKTNQTHNHQNSSSTSTSQTTMITMITRSKAKFNQSQLDHDDISEKKANPTAKQIRKKRS